MDWKPCGVRRTSAFSRRDRTSHGWRDSSWLVVITFQRPGVPVAAFEVGAARGVERPRLEVGAPGEPWRRRHLAIAGLVALIEDKAVRASAAARPEEGFPSALPSPMHCPRTGWSSRRFGPG